MAAKPFLGKGAIEWDLCVFCDSHIKDNDVSKLAENSLPRYRELADRWSKIDSSLSVCSKAPYAQFLSAAQRLSGVNGDINIHNSCHVSFQTRLKRTEEQCSKLQPSPGTESSDTEKLDLASIEFAEDPCHRDKSVLSAIWSP